MVHLADVMMCCTGRRDDALDSRMLALLGNTLTESPVHMLVCVCLTHFGSTHSPFPILVSEPGNTTGTQAKL